MELYELIQNFFGLEEMVNVTNFAEFLPWFIKVSASMTIFCVFMVAFFAFARQITNGVK